MEQLDRLSDTELIVKYIQEREPEYIRRFLENHINHINNGIMKVLKGYDITVDRAKEIRNDIFHDVFVEVLGTLGTEPGFDQWLSGIVHRVALREARKISRIISQTGNYNQQNLIKRIPAYGSNKNPILSDELLDAIEQFKESLSKRSKKHSDIFGMYYQDVFSARKKCIVRHSKIQALASNLY